MLSSVNLFGGLSSVELLTLFGAKSSSPSSTSASTTQSASGGVSGASTNNPANAIQTILAQAQIEHAQTITSWGLINSVTTERINVIQPSGPTISSLLAQAQAEQTQAEQTLTNSWGGSASTAYAAQAPEGSITSFSEESDGVTESTSWAGQESWASTAASMSATSVSLAPAPDAISGSSLNQTGPVDNFQFAATADNQTFAFGFTLEGLSQVEHEPDSNEYSVGSGTLTDFFQINLSVDGYGGGLSFNIGGLDAEQAQQVAAAFDEATSAPNNVETAINTGVQYTETYIPSTGYQYTEGYNPGVSVSFGEIIGY
ncbi:MAG: hypothetical protein EPN75_02855 [Beijerinckiaceae bacterium]|nr:MAG: hypothetical protein EPN75_02855 [Beijerinckiaceae bacterium]